MNKVVVSVRMDAAVRDQFQAWAKEDRRSLGNYLESLFMQECARRKNGDVTLSSLDVKLDRLLAFHVVKEKPKQKKESCDGTKKLSAYDMEFEDFLSEPYWRKWIDHLHKSEVHLTHYQGALQYERFRELDDSGVNCESLVIELIKRTAKSIYIPNEWQRDLERR